MSKKGKEKCKDEPETVGQPRGGAMSGRAEWRSKSQNATVGSGKKSPHGGPRPNNPPLDHSPRTHKSGNPRSKKAGKRGGPARGGDKAVAVAARDAVSQQDGLKDALREQVLKTDEQEEVNMHLRRDLTSVTDNLKQAEEKLGLHRNAISTKNDEKQKNFLCQYEEDSGRALTLFILMTVVFPFLFVGYMAVVEEAFDILGAWWFVIAMAVYQVAAVFLDRYVCAKRGYRSIFSKRITISYSAVTQEEWDDLDRRADDMSLRELKHVDPRYSVIACRKTLNGILINRNSFEELTGVPDYLLISHELLSQVTTPKIMMADDALVVSDRLAAALKTTHTVNVDRDKYQQGDDVAGNTKKVALALWHQTRQRAVQDF